MICTSLSQPVVRGHRVYGNIAREENG